MALSRHCSDLLDVWWTAFGHTVAEDEIVTTTPLDLLLDFGHDELRDRHFTRLVVFRGVLGKQSARHQGSGWRAEGGPIWY
jgi:hypothetical protein